jgi:putative acetyltransferase
MLRIVDASGVDGFLKARCLFEEYATSIGTDLCFQGFQEELASLPGKYAPPNGRLLLAIYDNDTAGCVALRALDGDICEMKRLFVRPAFRSLGLGRELTQRIIQEAKEVGYQRMRLDTLPTMFLELALNGSSS